jgi:hypothetical protein
MEGEATSRDSFESAEREASSGDGLESETQLTSFTDTLAETWCERIDFNSKGWEEKFEELSYRAARASTYRRHGSEYFKVDKLVGTVAYTLLMSAIVERAVRDPLMSEMRRAEVRHFVARLQVNTVPLLLETLPLAVRVQRYFGQVVQRLVMRMRTALFLSS